MRIKQFVQGRWFAIASFALASISVVLWESAPRLGWLPLVIALLPWLARMAAGQSPFRRTGFEIALLIFLVTAGVGVWAAYHPAEAWEKFWLLTGGVLLFYTLAGQPRENLWWAAGFLALVGTGVALYFLLTNDWQVYPAKVDLFNQIGLWWMNTRPRLPGGPVHPNNAAGIIAISAPFLLALGQRAWKQRRVGLLVSIAAAGCVALVAFLLATSRGAAFALLLGALAWGAFAGWANRARMRSWLRGTAGKIIAWLAAALLLGMLLVFWRESMGLTSVFLQLPGSGDRLADSQAALRLIGDFPFTGGGLNSFPGLYSQYILGVPFFFVLNSHNLYLDVALEQGIIGALALILVYLGGLRAVFPRAATSLLCRASFVSLLVLLFHGLVDNIIYDPGGAALVFLLPGIALAASRAEGDIPGRSPIVDFFRGRGYLAGAVAVAALLIFAFAQRQQLIAAWNADLGAVEMSRVELVDFPTNRWDEGQNLDRLRPAEAHFLRALQADPNQRTANHRLGLIALQRRDFATAADYLERAHRADPGHHGITKALAYSYIWAGWPGKAMPLLGDIPEARGEIAVYAWWWQEQDRADLARQAIVVAGLLQSALPAAAQK